MRLSAVIDRRHPHARYHDDLAERFAREKHQDHVCVGVLIALVLAWLGVLVWIADRSS